VATRTHCVRIATLLRWQNISLCALLISRLSYHHTVEYDNVVNIDNGGWYCVVGIDTLDSLRNEFRLGEVFYTRPTKPPVQWVLGLNWGKVTGVWCSPPTSS